MSPNANTSGSRLENNTASYLKDAEVYYIRQYRTGIYGILGKLIRVDFYLPHTEKGIYVECKRQDTTGSAEEKCVCLARNILEFYNKPAIVIVSGLESKTILDFLKEESDGKQMRTMKLDEFHSFVDSIAEKGTGVNSSKIYDPNQKKLF